MQGFVLNTQGTPAACLVCLRAPLKTQALRQTCAFRPYLRCWKLEIALLFLRHQRLGRTKNRLRLARPEFIEVSYLLTPEQYDYFAAPIVQGMFEHCAPDPADWRFQHSDSAMEHLVPILARFHLHEANFGCELIREHMPRTVIQGQLTPFTYSRDDRVGMVAEFLRDKQAVGATRGLRYATAGSVNNGSRLHGLRLIMAAVQRWGWY